MSGGDIPSQIRHDDVGGGGGGGEYIPSQFRDNDVAGGYIPLSLGTMTSVRGTSRSIHGQ